MNLALHVLRDKDHPGRPCPPAAWIRDLPAGPLLDDLAEQLSIGAAASGMTNCHSVALSFLVNFHEAGHRKRVRMVSGYVDLADGSGRIAHSWVEADGWAIDGAAGEIVIARADWYREHKDADVRATISGAQFAAGVPLWGPAGP